MWQSYHAKPLFPVGYWLPTPWVVEYSYIKKENTPGVAFDVLPFCQPTGLCLLLKHP